MCVCVCICNTYIQVEKPRKLYTKILIYLHRYFLLSVLYSHAYSICFFPLKENTSNINKDQKLFF